MVLSKLKDKRNNFKMQLTEKFIRISIAKALLSGKTALIFN